MHRLLIQVGFVGVLAVASIPVLGEAITSDPQFLDSRIRATKAIFTGNFAADASFRERAESYAVAKAPNFSSRRDSELVLVTHSPPGVHTRITVQALPRHG